MRLLGRSEALLRPITALPNAMRGVGHGRLGFAALGCRRSREGRLGAGRTSQGPTGKLVSPSISEKAKPGWGCWAFTPGGLGAPGSFSLFTLVAQSEEVWLT